MVSEKVYTYAWVTVDCLFDCVGGPEMIFSILRHRLECFSKREGMILLEQPKVRVELPAPDDSHYGESVKIHVVGRAVPFVSLERSVYGGHLC